MEIRGSAAKTVYYLRKINCLHKTWIIHHKIKCKSTEIELSNWLRDSEIKKNLPVAIIAREQQAGFGQNSRKWYSPRGGIWLSVAYPIFSNQFSTDIFSLSLATKLCEMLIQENINVDLKWPNDILYDKKKLIGFLPRIVTRGKEILYVRIGLGMNLLNKTPEEGIALAKVLKTKNICEYYWTAKILKALYDAVFCNKSKKHIIESANRFLSKSILPKGYKSGEWTIKEIDHEGNLRIFNQTKEEVLTRF